MDPPRDHGPGSEVAEVGRRSGRTARARTPTRLHALPALTDTTITDLDLFAAEIDTVREQGYAVCHGEDVTYSNGASAAIHLHGRPIAAIDLWGPDRRVPESRLHELGAAVAACATDVGLLLARPVT